MHHARVVQSGGGRYSVQTGRRDGTVSLSKNVNLPSPSISVSDSIQAFAKKGLNATDMIYLLGTPLHHLKLQKYQDFFLKKL